MLNKEQTLVYWQLAKLLMVALNLYYFSTNNTIICC